MTKKSILFFLSGIFIISCTNSISKSNSESNSKTESKMQSETTKGSFAGPPTIVYKTKAVYFNLVPVILSEDKTDIVNYPSIKDVYYKGELAYPTRLSKGYLMDNRGIGKNVAFLNITYEDYSKLSKTPSKEELKEMILDDEPLTEIYNCGSKFKYKNLIEDINELIESDKLKDCKNLK